MYSAGVLLYFRIGDVKHFLLGNDTKYNCWSDFGGKVEMIDDNNPKKTATREFYEETAGVVFSKIHMYNLLKTSIKLNCTSYNNQRYYMYLVECDVTDISKITFDQFAIQQDILSNAPNMTKFREKRNIKTFTANDILSNETLFRPVFYSSFFKNKDVIQSAY
jgi:predicted NUDIX family NTP pyrophosphohydrolase